MRGLEKDIVGRKLAEAKAQLDMLSADNDSLSAESLCVIANAYQSLCSLYGYLETFYPQMAETRQARRLVFSGRQLLYGRRLERSKLEREPFLIRVRMAFKVICPYIILSALIMVTSGLLASAVVAINPSTAWLFLSEETAADLSQGKLWTQSVRGQSSFAAAGIATNNIKVTFAAFALGITGGVGTVLILVFNGAMLGSMLVAIQPYGMAKQLLEFIIAHGFLELSIIAVAGGCGLYIGDALLSPGSKTRKSAIQEHGREAVDLLLFSALWLIPAGIVEGYVSPYAEVPLIARLVIGISLAFTYWSLIASNRLFRLRAKLNR